MAVESIFYSVAGISCRGALIWDEAVKANRPLLLMAPNWRGVIKPAIEAGQMLAEQGYAVFVADMFGEGNGPVGTEDPMEFIKPFMSDVATMRRRIAAGLDTLTREADRRAIGDINRRAAIGFCFGGLNVLDLARTGADVAAVGRSARSSWCRRSYRTQSRARRVRGGDDGGRRTLGAPDVRRCRPRLHRSASQPPRSGRLQRARRPARLCACPCFHCGCVRAPAVKG